MPFHINTNRWQDRSGKFQIWRLLVDFGLGLAIAVPLYFALLQASASKLQSAMGAVVVLLALLYLLRDQRPIRKK